MPVSIPWRVALCVAPLLFCGCSAGIYAPYPPPIPCVHRGRTLIVAAGVPHQVEYQQRVFGRADLVLGTALLTFHADSAAGASSAAGLLGVRYWMLPVDRRVFNVGVSGGATFIRSAHGGADTTLTGGELSVTPGFFYKRLTWAFPLRLGGGADPAGAVYFHTGAGLQGMVRGERLAVGLRCEYVAGFGLGERLALIVWPVNLNVHVSHLF